MERPQANSHPEPAREASSEKESMVTVPLRMMSLVSIRGRGWGVHRPAHPT